MNAPRLSERNADDDMPLEVMEDLDVETDDIPAEQAAAPREAQQPELGRGSVPLTQREKLYGAWFILKSCVSITVLVVLLGLNERNIRKFYSSEEVMPPSMKMC
jgi:hypothetical protein